MQVNGKMEDAEDMSEMETRDLLLQPVITTAKAITQPIFVVISL